MRYWEYTDMLKLPIQSFSLWGYLLRVGCFNSLIFIGTAIVFLKWGLVNAQGISLCHCEAPPSFMLYHEIFPEDMSLPYLLNWLYAFLGGVVLEFLLLLPFSIKKPLLALSLPLMSFLHNLPGLLFILTLMSQEAYFNHYLTATLISLVFLFIYRLNYDFQASDSQGSAATLHKVRFLLSRLASLYLIAFVLTSEILMPMGILFLLIYLIFKTTKYNTSKKT